MVKEIITKELADEFIKLEGEVRGISIKADGENILEKNGEKGLKKLEAKLSEIGHPVEFKKVKTMNFYPLGLKAIVLLSIKEVFEFSDEDISKMGEFQSKLSLIIKTFMRYFFSLQKMAQKTQDLWSKYYTVGTLAVIELNEKEKRGILRLKNFKLHPLHCKLLCGFFGSIVKMMVKNPTTCKEIKCMFKGDDYHDFLIKW